MLIMLRQEKNSLVVVSIKLFEYSPLIKDIAGLLLKNSFQSLLFIFSDIYHTKRMQQISCVQWTQDNKYVISGSDEMCLRLWKAKASEKLGVVSYQ
jgi:hypothetical protein